MYIEDVLEKLEFGMTKEEVIEIINQDYTNEIMRMSWHPPHAGPKSKVAAYFYKGKLIRISWLKLLGLTKYVTVYGRSQ